MQIRISEYSSPHLLLTLDLFKRVCWVSKCGSTELVSNLPRPCLGALCLWLIGESADITSLGFCCWAFSSRWASPAETDSSLAVDNNAPSPRDLPESPQMAGTFKQNALGQKSSSLTVLGWQLPEFNECHKTLMHLSHTDSAWNQFLYIQTVNKENCNVFRSWFRWHQIQLGERICNRLQEVERNYVITELGKLFYHSMQSRLPKKEENM